MQVVYNHTADDTTEESNIKVTLPPNNNLQVKLPFLLTISYR